MTLGKAQFQIVADAPKEFDIYMKKTLGATEADLARREDIRYDRFGVHGSRETLLPVRSDRSKYRHSRSAGRNAKDPESEDEESSEASDEDDDDNDDEN